MPQNESGCSTVLTMHDGRFVIPSSGTVSRRHIRIVFLSAQSTRDLRVGHLVPLAEGKSCQFCLLPAQGATRLVSLVWLILDFFQINVSYIQEQREQHEQHEQREQHEQHIFCLFYFI